MANKFYAPGQQRAARVGALFDAIAPRYDLINDLQSFGLHRLWKRRLLQLARIGRGEWTLDLCCGTGDLALAMTRRGARAVGLDFSAPMLAVAAARARIGCPARHRARVSIPGADASVPTSPNDPHPAPGQLAFVRGDALRLPFVDACFHVAAVSYGLRNLASLSGGLGEMLRVLRPGGRLFALDFGKPDQPQWRRLYFAYLRRWVPFFGQWFCGDPETYGYILESLKNYPAQSGVAAILGEIGCRNVRTINLLGGIMSITCGEKTV